MRNERDSRGGDRGDRAPRRFGGDRDRDRSGPPARDRPATGGAGSRRGRPERRVYVSNIPFDFRWQELKDLFRHEGEHFVSVDRTSYTCVSCRKSHVWFALTTSLIYNQC